MWNSTLHLILGTFRSYSWCPLNHDNNTKVLCETNPNYRYDEIVSVSAQNLTNAGTFTWQNVALNYTTSNSTNGPVLSIGEQSGPACNPKEGVSTSNCEQVVIVNFQYTSYGEWNNYHIVSSLCRQES